MFTVMGNIGGDGDALTKDASRYSSKYRSKIHRYRVGSDCCNKALVPGRAQIDMYPECGAVTVSAGAAPHRVNHHSWSRRHQHDICWHAPRPPQLSQIDTRNCRQGGGLQSGILLGSPEHLICSHYEWMNIIIWCLCAMCMIYSRGTS